MADAELLVHFDLDRSPASGCAFPTAEGAAAGVEEHLWKLQRPVEAADIGSHRESAIAPAFDVARMARPAQAEVEHRVIQLAWRCARHPRGTPEIAGALPGAEIAVGGQRL